MGLGYETGDLGYYIIPMMLFPLKTIDFEGLVVPCPNNPGLVLEVDYGPDYMELPNETQRDQPQGT